MNKIYKVIWSDARNAYVVVSEIAKNHGSKSCSTKKLLTMLIATGVMTCVSVAPVMAANPALTDTRIEVGDGANASGEGSVAIGQNAAASDLVAIAIGRDAVASGGDSIAIGSQTKATKQYSVAVGNDIGFTAYAGTAVGQQAYASGDDSTAIGTMTNVDADYNSTHDDWRKAGVQSTAIGAYAGSWGLASTAVGGFSKAEGRLATAVGYNSQANVDYGTALGDYSEVKAGWGVAIGASSVADRESGVVGAFAPEGADSLTWKANGGAVSVGSATLTRQITNVAAGTEDTDAVNVAQLKQVASQAIANNATNISSLSHSISNLDNRVNKVGAGAAALAALHPLDFDPDAKWDFAAGYGNYRGTNAAAVGAYYRPNEDTMFSVGGTFGNGENMVNAGVSFKLGAGSSHVSTSRVAMAKEIKELRAHMAAQDKLIAQLTGPVNALTGSHIQADLNTLFPDVPKNHWAYDYVTKLAQAGYIEGYPDGNFKGDAMMTRYEFAAVIYRAMMNGAARDAKLGGDENLNKLLKEFEPELEYIRIDTIAKDKAGNPTIQRVRTVKANTNK